MTAIKTHHDLDVWQLSMELAVQLYSLTEGFPLKERYGLVSQIRRAAVSIPSNIAEGASRNSSRQFSHFISVSLGSATEIETQLELAFRLGFANNIDPQMQLLVRIRQMLIRLRKSLDAKKIN